MQSTIHYMYKRKVASELQHVLFSNKTEQNKKKNKYEKKLHEIKMYRLHRPPVEIILGGKSPKKNVINFFFLFLKKKQ